MDRTLIPPYAALIMIEDLLVTASRHRRSEEPEAQAKPHTDNRTSRVARKLQHREDCSEMQSVRSNSSNYFISTITIQVLGDDVPWIIGIMRKG